MMGNRGRNIRGKIIEEGIIDGVADLCLFFYPSPSGFLRKQIRNSLHRMPRNLVKYLFSEFRRTPRNFMSIPTIVRK